MHWSNVQAQFLFCSVAIVMTLSSASAFADNNNQDDALLIQPAGVSGAPETIRERYDDGKVRIERLVTLDDDGNYVNHGEWKMLSRAGDVIAEGHYDMGKRIGTWTRWNGRQDVPELSEFPFT